MNSSCEIDELVSPGHATPKKSSTSATSLTATALREYVDHRGVLQQTQSPCRSGLHPLLPDQPYMLQTARHSVRLRTEARAAPEPLHVPISPGVEPSVKDFLRKQALSLPNSDGADPLILRDGKQLEKWASMPTNRREKRWQVCQGEFGRCL